MTQTNQMFLCTHECEYSFNNKKEPLTSSLVLDISSAQQFNLDTDASDECLCAVLSQDIDGQEHAISYWIKWLSKPERNYWTAWKELLAVAKAEEHFHLYFYDRKFLLPWPGV